MAAAALLLLLMLLVTTVRVGADCRAQCAQCGDSTHAGDALRATICTLECRSGLTVAQYWRACQLFLGQDTGPAWVQQRSPSGVPEGDPPGDEGGPVPASPQQLDKKYGGFFRRVRSLVPHQTNPWAPGTPFAPQTGSSPPSLASVLAEIRNYLQTLDSSPTLQQHQQLAGVALPSGVAVKRYGGFGRGRFRTKRGPDGGRDDAGDPRAERERAEEEEEEEEEEEDEEEREDNGDEPAAAAQEEEEEADGEDGGQGDQGEMAPEGKTVQKRYGGFMRRVGRPHKASWANQKRYGGFMRRFFGVSIRSEDSEGPADKRFSAYARRRLVQQ